VGQPASGVNTGQCPGREGRTGRRGEIGQLEMPYLAEIERLGDRERPVPKLRLGREQLDADAILRERPQSQGGLERSDAPAGNQNPHPAVVSVHCIFPGRCSRLVYLSVFK
jgi:hypothetical protein